jgi:hypothetical protein
VWTISSIALISCVPIEEALGGEAKGFIGFPTGNFGEGSQSPSFGGTVTLPVSGSLGIRGAWSIQHYKHVGSEELDAKFIVLEFGCEGTVPVPGVEFLFAQVAASPAVVPARWRGPGLNHSELLIGMSLGANMLARISERYLVTVGLTRYLSDSGTTRIYFDRLPLELPGLSETVAELGLGVEW